MDVRLPLAFAACLSLTAQAAAPACRAASGATTRPVVELFTSEGCDSCPPADRWFSAAFKDVRTGPIALAFHVDYWDRLGWKDRFASPLYTTRQHDAADANGASFVYTPQVLLQGRDVKWRDRAVTAALERAAAEPARAHVEIAAERAGTALRVHALARGGEGPLPADAVLTLAYVDSDLNSDVKAGENRGVRLHHDHVVRALATSSRKDGPSLAADATFTVPAEAGRDPAVVAFVQRARDGAVLQAAALPLADCPDH
jgi:hypothetical protein